MTTSNSSGYRAFTAGADIVEGDPVILLSPGVLPDGMTLPDLPESGAIFPSETLPAYHPIGIAAEVIPAGGRGTVVLFAKTWAVKVHTAHLVGAAVRNGDTGVRLPLIALEPVEEPGGFIEAAVALIPF